MAFNMENIDVPDGSVLRLGIRYQGSDKIFTYAALRAGGLWYLTGTGRVPVAAGYKAVQRWLDRDGREVVSAELLTGSTRLLW